MLPTHLWQIKCIPSACSIIQTKHLRRNYFFFYMGVLFILMCNIVTLSFNQLAMRHQWMSHQKHRDKVGDKGASPAAHLSSHSTAATRDIHRSCTLFTGVARTLLPLCREGELVFCHDPLSCCEVKQNKAEVMDVEETVILHVEGTSPFAHVTFQLTLKKEKCSAGATHPCRAAAGRPQPRQDRPDPEDTGVKTSTSSCEYRLGAKFFSGGIRSGSNLTFQWPCRCH